MCGKKSCQPFKIILLIGTLLYSHPFRPGEEIEYTIRFGFINVGTMLTKVGEEIIGLGGRKVFHVRNEMKTNPFFDAIYRIRNVDESFIDCDRICSLRYVKSYRESKYKKDLEANFDYSKNLAFIRDDGNEKLYSTRGYVQDKISIWYYFRTINIGGAGKHHVNMFDDDKIVPLEIRIRKREKVRIGIGEFDCILVEPVAKEIKNKILVWFTADERRIPIKMKMEMPIGYLTAEANYVR